MLGSERFLTLNIHHSDRIFGTSNVAPLGLIRVKQSATGDYLEQLVSARLENFGLFATDLVAATTDGAANVLKAVERLGICKQRCFVHGLDLIVRKVICGKKGSGFDIEIRTTPNNCQRRVQREKS